MPEIIFFFVKLDVDQNWVSRIAGQHLLEAVEAAWAAPATRASEGPPPGVCGVRARTGGLPLGGWLIVWCCAVGRLSPCWGVIILLTLISPE